MMNMSNFFIGLVLSIILWTNSGWGDNQTPTFSPILPETGNLPFTIAIEQADFSLPNGIHSGVNGFYKGKWLFLAGRSNGLHDFDNSIPNNNFPPQSQNTNVYVIDLTTKSVFVRSLMDPSSGLTQHQIDLLSVTSPQGYRSDCTLYMTGGYGIDTATSSFSTKDVLTAINIPGLMHWVMNPSPGESAVQHIRQISDPIFRVTGGYMGKMKDHSTLLVVGQNFTGYYVPGTNGDYSKQIRRFKIIDNGVFLGIKKRTSKPFLPNPNLRRRDLNVVPTIGKLFGKLKENLVIFAGVFTESGGVWTVPVKVTPKGIPLMPNPSLAKTFKQGMNHYNCATLGLYSRNNNNMYVLFFGGLSVGYFNKGVFETDQEVPFINQVTTVRIDPLSNYQQYIMDAEFPVIYSTQSNPGNPLLFGAGSDFIPANKLPLFPNGVLDFDKVGKAPFVAGYIVGGIQSTVPNTSSASDSAASPYIFKVVLIPKEMGQ